MAIEETTYGILSAAAGVTSLVPASRIKPPGDWQSLARPYIIQWPVTSSPTHTHSSTTVLLIDHYPSYQITVVADSYASARAVANAIKTAILGSANGNHSGTKYLLNGEFVLDFDTDRKIIEIALDFRVWQ